MSKNKIKCRNQFQTAFIRMIKENKILFLLSFVIALVVGLAYAYTPYYKAVENNFINIMEIVCTMAAFLSLFWILAYTIKKNTISTGKISDDTIIKNNKSFDFRLKTIIFMIFFLIGVFFLLLYYPGVGMYDSIYILSTDSWYVASQHPWLYCFIIRCLRKAVIYLGGDYETVLVVCSLLQIILCSAVYTYNLIWLRKKGLCLRGEIFCLITYLVFTPILFMHMIALYKDIPFSLVVVAWIPFLYEYVESKGAILTDHKTIIKMIPCIVLSFLRNNGLYIVTFILILMILVSFKSIKKIMLYIIFLIFMVVLSNQVEKELNVTHLFKETIGIPLQQIAAVVSKEGNLSKEEQQFVSNILPLDYIKENYNPYTADTLKWGGAPINNDFLAKNKVAFLKNYLNIFKNNFSICADAYWRSTYGFWSFAEDSPQRHPRTIYVEAFKDFFEDNDIQIKSIFSDTVQRKLENFYEKIAMKIGSGTYFWIFIFISLLILCVYDWKYICVLSPIIACWLTVMISTPIAFQPRYLLCIPMSLPLYIGILLLKIRRG